MTGNWPKAIGGETGGWGVDLKCKPLGGENWLGRQLMIMRGTVACANAVQMLMQENADAKVALADLIAPEQQGWYRVGQRIPGAGNTAGHFHFKESEMAKIRIQSGDKAGQVGIFNRAAHRTGFRWSGTSSKKTASAVWTNIIAALASATIQLV